MGITNTISELSKYFYEWHKNKYEEIHNGISSKIATLENNISNIETRLNNIYNEIHNNETGILTKINNLTPQVNTLVNDMSSVKSNKADKSSLRTWSDSHPLQLCSDTNGSIRDGLALPPTPETHLYINEDIRMARLTIDNMRIWNMDKNFYKNFFFIPFNAAPTTPTAMDALNDNNKAFYKVPNEYAPAMNNASASIGIGAVVVRANGYIEFKLSHKFNHFENVNVSIMWTY